MRLRQAFLAATMLSGALVPTGSRAAAIVFNTNTGVITIDGVPSTSINGVSVVDNGYVPSDGSTRFTVWATWACKAAAPGSTAHPT
jgi:hypothetical protein